ncbi:hypothetical protein NMG60_11031862 [Bertholletia excelsa]
MRGLLQRTPPTASRGNLPLLSFVPCYAIISRRPISNSSLLRCRDLSRLNSLCRSIRAHASNVGVGSGSYEGREENDGQKIITSDVQGYNSSKIGKPPNQFPYLLSLALVLLGCASAIAKSGFTAAFSLIFISEIGDKTFFIAALLAMQYEKGLVLLGAMGALSLMTVLSVIIGRIFHSVPAQFQTTLPIGEYAAVTLLLFFGLKSIKDAWDLPANKVVHGNENNPELGEYVEAEELVKEKVSKQLSNPLEILGKSFSLIFFAEWGDRSMLATIALSPWGVASGAIAGHFIATFIAALGGSFLAKYISEKLIGYLGGVLFIIFSVATFLGVF